MTADVTHADSIPVLERLVQFAGARHRVLTDNIANLSTPNFVARDLPVADFQAALGAAVDERRQRIGTAADGALELRDAPGLRFERNAVRAEATPAGGNLLYHDGNDRNLERTMQDLVENFMTFRSAAELLRSRFQLLNTAISERV